MRNKQPVSPIKKILPALIAAVSMTAFIGLTVLVFGLNALINRNGSVVQAAAQQDSALAADQSSSQDMQALLAEYQSRESQYQQELQQAADQINQITQQNQQYQQLFQALQNAGVIQVTSDGRILISAGASRRSGFGESENDDFR